MTVQFTVNSTGRTYTIILDNTLKAGLIAQYKAAKPADKIDFFSTALGLYLPTARGFTWNVIDN